MKWILEDLKRAYDQLRQWQTWLVIGLLVLFASIAYLIGNFAFRTDSVLVFAHRTAASCRTMTNGAIIFMFCGMIFFALAAVATLGEFQRYFESRRYKSEIEAKAALRGAMTWLGVAVAIAVGALTFFIKFCR